MHLRAADQSSLHTFASVATSYMWNDEATAYIAPRKDRYPNGFFHFQLRNAKAKYYRGEFLFLCVSDESDADWTGGEVVMGCCAYSTNAPGIHNSLPNGWLGNRFERWATTVGELYTHWFKLDQSADRTAYRHYLEVLQDEANFNEYFQNLPEQWRSEQKLGADGLPFHLELQLLGTHPDFRRKGVGRKMLGWGIKRAVEHNVPLILIATIQGRKLYASIGFRDIGPVKFATSWFGADGAQNETCRRLKSIGLEQGSEGGFFWAAMVWEPPALVDARLLTGAA